MLNTDAFSHTGDSVSRNSYISAWENAGSSALEKKAEAETCHSSHTDVFQLCSRRRTNTPVNDTVITALQPVLEFQSNENLYSSHSEEMFLFMVWTSKFSQIHCSHHLTKLWKWHHAPELTAWDIEAKSRGHTGETRQMKTEKFPHSKSVIPGFVQHTMTRFTAYIWTLNKPGINSRLKTQKKLNPQYQVQPHYLSCISFLIKWHYSPLSTCTFR